MNGIYLGSDILLAGTGSEGFGLPILEAQLFGCPVLIKPTFILLC